MIDEKPTKVNFAEVTLRRGPSKRADAAAIATVEKTNQADEFEFGAEVNFPGDPIWLHSGTLGYEVPIQVRSVVLSIQCNNCSMHGFDQRYERIRTTRTKSSSKIEQSCDVSSSTEVGGETSLRWESIIPNAFFSGKFKSQKSKSTKAVASVDEIQSSVYFKSRTPQFAALVISDLLGRDLSGKYIPSRSTSGEGQEVDQGKLTEVIVESDTFSIDPEISSMDLSLDWTSLPSARWRRKIKAAERTAETALSKRLPENHNPTRIVELLLASVLQHEPIDPLDQSTPPSRNWPQPPKGSEKSDG